MPRLKLDVSAKKLFFSGVLASLDRSKERPVVLPSFLEGHAKHLAVTGFLKELDVDLYDLLLFVNSEGKKVKKPRQVL
jgi:hypothetical protein